MFAPFAYLLILLVRSIQVINNKIKRIFHHFIDNLSSFSILFTFGMIDMSCFEVDLVVGTRMINEPLSLRFWQWLGLIGRFLKV